MNTSVLKGFLKNYLYITDAFGNFYYCYLKRLSKTTAILLTTKSSIVLDAVGIASARVLSNIEIKGFVHKQITSLEGTEIHMALKNDKVLHGKYVIASSNDILFTQSDTFPTSNIMVDISSIAVLEVV